MDYISSVWFKVGLLLFALLMASGIFIYLKMDRLITQVVNSSQERKSKLRQSIFAVLSVSKVVFWILPIYLFLVPSIYAIDQQLGYSLITLIPFMYIALVGAFLISRNILKAIDKSGA